MDRDQNFEQLMEKLRVEYIQGLPAKCDKIRELLAKKDVGSLQQEFHKLKGTGRTYGIPEISTLSAVLESICESRPQHVGTSVPVAVDLLSSIVLSRQQNLPLAVETTPQFLILKKYLD